MWKYLSDQLFAQTDWRDNQCTELLTRCYKELKALTDEVNKTMPASLQISIQEPTQARRSTGKRKTHRLFLSTPFWAAIIRAEESEASLFVFPAIELIDYRTGERVSNRKFQLELDQKPAGRWRLGNIAMTDSELNRLLKGLIADLLKKSRADMESLPEWVQSSMKEFSATGIITALMDEKQRLIESLVSEREAVKSELAREIHDTVIGDILHLRRSLSGAQRLTDEKMIKVLDGMSSRLRSICADLSPEDVHEWGLSTLLQDLTLRYSERTGSTCHFECSGELPILTQQVALQVFRIVQECLNNCERHAQAGNTTVRCSTNDAVLKIEIIDDGVGFDPEAVRRESPENCRGTQIIRERLQLIRSALPATLIVTSSEGNGTTVALEMNLQPDDTKAPSS